MASTCFDFSRLVGCELLGLDCTFPRLVVAEFVGPTFEDVEKERRVVLTQLRLYFVDGLVSELNFISQPSKGPSFPPFVRADICDSPGAAAHKKTARFVFEPGLIGIDFDDLVFTEERLSM